MMDGVMPRKKRGAKTKTTASPFRAADAALPILLIEDDPAVMEIVHTVLESAGCPWCAADLKRIFRNSPVLIVNDLSGHSVMTRKRPDGARF